jgi:eukaryotic-like serine/threonine-protein kinase
MTCPSCGTANHDGARFCGRCGAAMSATEPAGGPSLSEAPAMIGREIAGRYRMLAKLGEGGMGAVFRAEQISLKRTVAVKLLRPDILGNQLLLRRFNAEAEAVAKLSHPNTVNIYDFGQDADGTLFIAMEYIEGRSLRTVVQHEAPLGPRRALAIAAQVAASLADAHAHAIVHRDLKPDNVMLQDRGRERDIARVLDFGIAKLRDDTRATQVAMTQQGDMLGTPQYMAPEQIRAEPIDGRTDIYALGCLIYEMVTARLPHEGPTVMALLSKHLLEQPVPPSQRRPELGLPIELDRLVLGAMAKDPAARPPTMETFGEQIAGVLARQPAEPRSAQRSAVGPAAAAPMFTPHAPGSSPGAPLSSPGAPGLPPASTPIAYSALSVPPGLPSPSPVPPPPRFAIPPPPSRKKATVALAAILAVGAIAAVGIVVARSAGSAAKAPGDAAASPGHDQRDPAATPASDPWAPAATPASDPWAQPSAPAPEQRGTPPATDGARLAMGQGVTLIVPPGFQTTTQNGVAAAFDTRGVIIAGARIDVSTDDLRELTRVYAKRTGLSFESTQSVLVGGVSRNMAIFRGTYQGVAVRHAVVALIGPSYRLAVAFQAPTQLVKTDPTITSLLLEVYGWRILLP